MKKINKLNVEPRTLEELYGENFNNSMRFLREPEFLSSELDEHYRENYAEWRNVCDASVYGVIRLCGRQAQKEAVDRKFLLDDVFRLYTFMGNRIKYTYNREAHLWVFYIGVQIPGEAETSIWVQTPTSPGARRFTYGGLSPTEGLKLKVVPRDKSAYKRYVAPYEEELKKLTSKYYKEFKDSFNEVYRLFNDAARNGDNPSSSYSEWPHDRLLYL